LQIKAKSTPTNCVKILTNKTNKKEMAEKTNFVISLELQIVYAGRAKQLSPDLDYNPFVGLDHTIFVKHMEIHEKRKGQACRFPPWA